MTDNNPNGGYSVNTHGVNTIADRLDSQAGEIETQATRMRNDTFGFATQSAYPQAFGPEGAAAAQEADELILNYANALYQVRTTMVEAAGLLRKAMKLYATTDYDNKEKMENLKEVGH